MSTQSSSPIGACKPADHLVEPARHPYERPRCDWIIVSSLACWMMLIEWDRTAHQAIYEDEPTASATCPAEDDVAASYSLAWYGAVRHASCLHDHISEHIKNELLAGMREKATPIGQGSLFGTEGARVF